MTNEITQLGSAGLLAYLVVKEVLAFVKSRNGKANGSAGAKDPSYWILEFQKAVERGNVILVEKIERITDNQEELIKIVLRRK